MKVDELLAREKLTVVQILRDGPRFFIARVSRGKQTYIFKALVNASHDRSSYWANNLKREILFQEWFGEFSRFPVPRVYAYEFEPMVWYLREDVTGKLPNIKGSNFLFVSRFFQDQTVLLADFIHEIQAATDAIPAQLQTLVGLSDDWYQAEAMRSQIAVLSDRERNFIGDNILAEIEAIYDRDRAFFRTENNVLAHRELFATNMFLDKQKGFVVIDWENIEKRDRAHDASILWVRSFGNPEWQHKFLRRFVDQVSDESTFWRLFQFNIITQQVGNIAHFMAFANRNEKRQAPLFLKRAKESLVMAVENRIDI